MFLTNVFLGISSSSPIDPQQFHSNASYCDWTMDGSTPKSSPKSTVAPKSDFTYGQNTE